MGGRHMTDEWMHPLAPSAVLGSEGVPLSCEDGYPWALQYWDHRDRSWDWEVVGLVPLKRKLSDLRTLAAKLGIDGACRYVWVRHWSPDRINGRLGWRACIDPRKTIGPVRS